ncbi:hypothetical protein G3573_16475 [Caulobacter sp. 17J65-9]|nr:hypothetical protein [Caulobacter sp. 17J65-9]
MTSTAKAQTVFPPLEAGKFLQDCGAPDAAPDICRAREAVSAAEAKRRLGDQDVAMWRKGDRFRVVARNPAEVVSLAGGLAAPMARIDGTDLWSFTARIPRLDEAVIDFLVIPSADQPPLTAWRGPKAPPAAAFNPELKGQVVWDEVDSPALGEKRTLTVYLPPDFDRTRTYPVAYVADGSGVAYYARIVEPAIVAGRLPPVVLVGLESGAKRTTDYLLGWEASDAGFEKHEAFLLNEVMPRAERLYGASSRREQRLLIGKSNGGAWALDTALRHPDLFAQAAPMALGAGRAAGVDRPGRPRLFMATGVLDSFIRRSRVVAERAAKSGDELVFRTPVSGHGDVFYQDLLVEALAWAFGGGVRPS